MATGQEVMGQDRPSGTALARNAGSAWSGRLLDRKWLPTLGYLASIALTLALVGYAKVKFSKLLNLGGDTTQVLNFAKSYIDGYGFRYNPSLGYPGVQDNLFFPTFDFSERLMLWVFGRFTRFAETSYHLLYLVGISLMALGATMGLHRLGMRLWIAILGAPVFVLTPFFASRALGHDFLSLYFSAAFGGTLALLVASLPMEMSAGRFLRQPFIIVSVLLAATSGLYYAFFTCMFVTFGGLANASWQRRWTPLLTALIISAIVTPLLVLGGYGAGIVDVLTGRMPQVARSAFEQLGLGLNPAEAVGSLAVLPGLGWTMKNYEAYMPFVPGIKGLFEWPSALLSAIILLAPVSVAVLAGPAQPRDSRWRLVLMASLFLAFGMLYGIRGGLAYYFNLLVTPEIRGTDRLMPFLTFFALVIAATAVELALAARAFWIRLAAPILIVGALAWGAWPLVGVFAAKQQSVLDYTEKMMNIASVQRMLPVKDAAGITTVLQLPVVPWPEQPPIRNFDTYAHQQPYILDRPHSTTRWSYGSTLSQPAYKAVKTLFDEHATSGLAPAALAFGFDAILVEKLAYDSGELHSLAVNVDDNLASGCKVFEDKFRTLYILHAPPQRSLCLQ